MNEVATRAGALSERQIMSAAGVGAPSMTGQMLTMIAAAAENPNTDVAKLRELMAMQKELLADEAKVAFDRAMSECQAEMLPVAKDRENSHTKSRYATLEAVDEAIRPIYAKHGFSLSASQLPSNTAGEVVLAMDVAHRAGHTRRYELGGGIDTAGPGGKPNKTNIQGVGATVSYLRRYLTLMIFNLIIRGEDTDGNRPPNTKRISAEQKDRIVAELQQTGTNTLKFLEWANATTVDNILESQWNDVLNLFDKRRKDKGMAAFVPAPADAEVEF